MCRYCEDGVMIAAITTGNGSQEIWCYIEKEFLSEDVYLTIERHNKTKSNYYAKQMIQFCPMCGRRLNEKVDFSGILKDTDISEYLVRDGKLYKTFKGEISERKSIGGVE